jgi:hypothetical protein
MFQIFLQLQFLFSLALLPLAFLFKFFLFELLLSLSPKLYLILSLCLQLLQLPQLFLVMLLEMVEVSIMSSFVHLCLISFLSQAVSRVRLFSKTRIFMIVIFVFLSSQSQVPLTAHLIISQLIVIIVLTIHLLELRGSVGLQNWFDCYYLIFLRTHAVANPLSDIFFIFFYLLCVSLDSLRFSAFSFLEGRPLTHIIGVLKIVKAGNATSSIKCLAG